MEQLGLNVKLRTMLGAVSGRDVRHFVESGTTVAL